MTDKQTVYDIVRDHLMNQGMASISSVGCAYRGTDGTSCAIGCMIPDALYSDRLEGKAVGDLPRRVRRALGITENNARFFADLQEIHDCEDPEYWPEAFAAFAEKHGLRP